MDRLLSINSCLIVSILLVLQNNRYLTGQIVPICCWAQFSRMCTWQVIYQFVAEYAYLTVQILPICCCGRHFLVCTVPEGQILPICRLAQVSRMRVIRFQTQLTPFGMCPILHFWRLLRFCRAAMRAARNCSLVVGGRTHTSWMLAVSRCWRDFNVTTAYAVSMRSYHTQFQRSSTCWQIISNDITLGRATFGW